jgi:hypothetical protein
LAAIVEPVLIVAREKVALILDDVSKQAQQLSHKTVQSCNFRRHQHLKNYQ